MSGTGVLGYGPSFERSPYQPPRQTSQCQTQRPQGNGPYENMGLSLEVASPGIFQTYLDVACEHVQLPALTWSKCQQAFAASSSIFQTCLLPPSPGASASRHLWPLPVFSRSHDGNSVAPACAQSCDHHTPHTCVSSDRSWQGLDQLTMGRHRDKEGCMLGHEGFGTCRAPPDNLVQAACPVRFTDGVWAC
eukprot:1158806-Pelagomonas_calceolata.AAC.2